jgi:hypothetical protein
MMKRFLACTSIFYGCLVFAGGTGGGGTYYSCGNPSGENRDLVVSGTTPTGAIRTTATSSCSVKIGTAYNVRVTVTPRGQGGTMFLQSSGGSNCYTEYPQDQAAGSLYALELDNCIIEAPIGGGYKFRSGYQASSYGNPNFGVWSFSAQN